MTLTAKGKGKTGPIGAYEFWHWNGACSSYGENEVCHLTLTSNPTETQTTTMNMN